MLTQSHSRPGSVLHRRQQDRGVVLCPSVFPKCGNRHRLESATSKDYRQKVACLLHIDDSQAAGVAAIGASKVCPRASSFARCSWADADLVAIWKPSRGTTCRSIRTTPSQLRSGKSSPTAVSAVAASSARKPSQGIKTVQGRNSWLFGNLIRLSIRLPKWR